MGGGSSIQSVLMIVVMIVIFYFFMIRPNMKKQKELKKFRESIKAGDKIVTIGGIHGKILEVADSTVLINSEGSKIRIEKSAISKTTEDRLEAGK
jgi:preprotein translocase subunit YajC